MSFRSRIPAPPSSGNPSLDRWSRDVSNALNSLPNFSTYSTADGPEGVVDGVPGTIFIEENPSINSRLWVKNSGGTSSGWTSFPRSDTSVGSGTSGQVLHTNASSNAVWTSNISVPGTIHAAGVLTSDSSTSVVGPLSTLNYLTLRGITEVSSGASYYDDLNVDNVAIMVSVTSSAQTISGLVGGVRGRVMLVKTEFADLVFTKEDTRSATTNRFNFATTLSADDGLTMFYFKNRWQLADKQ